MENYEIKMLKQEVKKLKEQVADLRAAQDSDGALLKEVYTSVYQYIADIHDYLWPVVYKIFPHFADGKKEIDAFMNNRRDGADKKKL